MLNTKTLSILLAAAIAVTGVLLYLQAEGDSSSSLVLTLEQDVVNPPNELRGIAGMLPENIVDVNATIDGVDIDGSPDEDMDGPVNRFAFPVDETMRGKIIRIVATGADGKVVTKYVQVH